MKLLDEGLVLEAAKIDEHVNTKNEEEEEQEEEEEKKEDLDMKKDLVQKINSYVQSSIMNRKNEKIQSTLITDSKRKLEKEFLSSINKPKCQNCQAISPKFRHEKQQKIFKRPISKKSQNINSSKNINFNESDQYISPITVKEHLFKLWKNEETILGLLYGNDPSMFFLTVLSVTPTKFRPVSKMGDLMFEHPQNINLVEILKANLLIQDIQELEKAFFLKPNLEIDELKAKKEDFLRKTVDAWVQLQTFVNYLLDSSNAPNGKNGKTPPPGIRQLLEKKEGTLFLFLV
jgi:DNA-directed RNA polymerase I subunit RPA1